MISRAHSQSAPRGGMTLIEMLVATTATLILMGAIAQIFSVFGSAVTNSRSMIEMDARMRTVAWRLRSDLAGATARPVPPISPASGEGYLEIIEGPLDDRNAADGTTTLNADTDDVLLFTTRSNDVPFTGTRRVFNGTALTSTSATVESSVAEVAWFLRPTVVSTNPFALASSPATYTLFRRQLLVVGYSGFDPFFTGRNTFLTGIGWDAFYDLFDISARYEGGGYVPNSLADLTRRECRFMHGATFPFLFASHQLPPNLPGATGPYVRDGMYFNAASSSGSARAGEDIVLTNVIAFDVRVFDPSAPVEVVGSDARVPGDPIYTVGDPATVNGCYVDLGVASTVTSGTTRGPSGITPHFVGTGIGPGLAGQRTYDTWSTHYETNGVNEDGDLDASSNPLVDEGTNGVDDNNNGLVDEIAEQETSPPYPFPLRGLEIRIRCYEPASRQVRQVTLRHTFVPH